MSQETMSSQDPASNHWPGYMCNSDTDRVPCLICGRTGRSRGAIIFAKCDRLVCQECIQQMQGLLDVKALMAFAD